MVAEHVEQRRRDAAMQMVCRRTYGVWPREARCRRAGDMPETCRPASRRGRPGCRQFPDGHALWCEHAIVAERAAPAPPPTTGHEILRPPRGAAAATSGGIGPLVAVRRLHARRKLTLGKPSAT